MTLSLSARIALAVALALLALAVVLPGCVAPLVGARIHAMARSRGLEARWERLAFSWPFTVELRGLVLERSDTAAPFVTARRVEASLGPRGWNPRPRIAGLVLEHAHVTLPAGGAEDDTTATRDDDSAGSAGPAAPRVRAAAQQLADALLLPARRLPELRVTDLDVQRGDSLFARLDALTLTHRPGGLRLAATGVLAGERRMPFDVALAWNADDRLVGRANFRVSDDVRGMAAVAFVVDARVTQDRRAGVLRVAEGSRVRMGRADMRVAGEIARSGPRASLRLEMLALTAHDVQRSVPPAMLGPLANLSVRGSWDWHASLNVDVAAPDSTRFTADVIPHGLQLGDADSRLRLGRLAGPFLAEIHVPRGIVYRDLSPANPHWRPIERISPLLRFALLTNEDGSFYHHHGFNTEAIELAMAANLRSGTFKRGAGTITMQLVRNLFLGHQRTLSRKGQEVVLTWVLEHLTGISKDRLLELYLNIIEWGPDVHGADEATRFYFDKDAADVTLDEALFLTVLVPSPRHWKSRLDASGELRPWARSQMAYIARKMVSRGWLDPAMVPDAASLHVRLRGPAAQAFTAPVVAPPPLAPADSAFTPAGEPIHI